MEKRVITEDPKFKDFFGDFEIEYLPFVEWLIVDDDTKLASVTFEDEKPTEYKNKWARTQWKMKVIQDADLRMLSGGKRLFSSLSSFCKKHNKYPVSLGIVNIFRIGNGFDTKYLFKFPVVEKSAKRKSTKKKV